MNIYISSILVIASLFILSIAAYEWGIGMIDDALNHVSKEEGKNDLNLIKEMINNVIASGVGSERTFSEVIITPNKNYVIISNGTNLTDFNVTTINGIKYDVYFEKGMAYIFIYNISLQTNKVSYVKYINYSVYNFGGNILLNYSNNLRYFHINGSKIYIYNLIMG